MSRLSASGGQSIGASASVLPVNISRFNLEEPQVTWGALSPHIGHPITALVGREWDDGGVYSREGADAAAGSAGDLGAELHSLDLRSVCSDNRFYPFFLSFF